MTVTPAPVLAVIIPHYEDLARLARCLDALAPQLAAAPEVACVVVDNASPGGLGDLADRYPTVRFVIEPQKGAAAARNRGVCETATPRLLLLDCDCVPAPDWLATALSLPADDAVTGGCIDTFDETPPPRSGTEAFEAVFAFHQRDYVEKKGFSVTANLLTTRRVFETTGPLVVGVSEDVDWCRRAVAAEFPLRYADGLRVAHPTRSDWPALVRKWRRMSDEKFQLHGTGPGSRLTWFLLAGAVLASGPVHLVRILRAPQLSPADRLRAGATLLRLRTLRAGWMLRQGLTGR